MPPEDNINYGFINRFTEGLVNGKAQQLIEAKAAEGLKAVSVTDEDEGWKRLTGNTTRQLTSVSQDRQIEIAYWLWKNNPLANWIIEIMTAFIVGEGWTIDAKDETVKKVLDDFWNHPLNNFPLMLENYVREQRIFGEQLWPKFTGKYSGKVATGYIDPALIKSVVTDPENVKIIIGVKVKGTGFHDGKKYKTVLAPGIDEFLSPDAQAFRESCRYECYYFSINNVTNEPRGTSELYVIADWLDAYEQFLFDYADKWPLLNMFVWDLLVDGGTPDEIKKQMKNFTKKSGSIFGHNEKVTLEEKTPDLKAADAGKGARIFRNHILGAKSIPEHWYGGGGDVNRATANEMDAPTFKTFSAKQKFHINAITFVLNDVLREADEHGMLEGIDDDDKTFSLNVAELATKDITKFAQAIQQLSTSLVAAVTQKWIDENTAVKLFAFSISLIGYEIDVKAVKEALEKEKNMDGYQDYKNKGEKSGETEE